MKEKIEDGTFTFSFDVLEVSHFSTKAWKVLEHSLFSYEIQLVDKIIFMGLLIKISIHKVVFKLIGSHWTALLIIWRATTKEKQSRLDTCPITGRLPTCN